MFTRKSVLMPIAYLLFAPLAINQDGLGTDVVVIEARNAPQVRELQTLYNQPNSNLDSVTFSPDGMQLAFIERELNEDSVGVVRIWDMNDLRESHLPIEQELTARSIAFSPNGNLFAVGDDKGTLVIIDRRFSNTLTIINADTAQINAIAIPPGNQLITYAADNSEDVEADFALRFIEISSGNEFFSLPLCEDRSCPGAGLNIVFRPSGDLFATATVDMIVRLWDGELKEEIAALENYDSQANELQFTPDGVQLVYTAIDGIRIWNISAVLRMDGEKDDFRIIAPPMEGEVIESIALHPDGQILAIGYQDGTVRLWNMESGEQLTVLEGHEGRVVSLAFSPDGTLLASGGTDGTIRLWGIPSTDT